MGVWLIHCLLLTTLHAVSLQGSLQLHTGYKRHAVKRDIQTTGVAEQGYCISIYLGTPPQKFSVVIDTGSANFALSGSEAGGISTYFDATISSTYKAEQAKEIKVSYFNGSWRGVLGSDVLKLCEGCSPARVDVALISHSADFFVNGTLWQGILGMGYRPLVQPEPDAATPPLDSFTDTDVFTITLCGRETQDDVNLQGTLELQPPLQESEYLYIDIVKEWFYQIEVMGVAVQNKTLQIDCKDLNDPAAFLDSGTTNIIVPTKVYVYLYTAIYDYAYPKANLTESELQDFMDRSTFRCVLGNKLVFSSFPTLYFSFSYNTSQSIVINVPPEQYIRQTWDSIQKQKELEEGRYCYKFGIEHGEAGLILGAAFMEGLHIVHDRNKSRIGFRVAECKVLDPVFTKVISGPHPRTARSIKRNMVLSSTPKQKQQFVMDDITQESPYVRALKSIHRSQNIAARMSNRSVKRIGNKGPIKKDLTSKKKNTVIEGILDEFDELIAAIDSKLKT